MRFYCTKGALVVTTVFPSINYNWSPSNDATRQQKYQSTMAQMMAGYLMVPSHYINHGGLNISGIYSSVISQRMCKIW